MGLTLVLSACGPDGPQLPQGVQAVAIEKFVPQGRVEQTGLIEIVFDREVISAQQVGNVVSPSQFVAISPHISAKARWKDRRSVVIRPLSQLTAATRYRATIRRDALGPDWEVIGNRSFRFRTPIFALLDAVAQRVDNKTQVSLSFTHPVRPEDVQAAVSFQSADSRALRAHLLVEKASRRPQFVVEGVKASPEGPATVWMHIDPGLSSLQGGASLGKDVGRLLTVQNQRTLGGLYVEAVEPVQVGRQLGVDVRLSHPLQLSEITSKVKFSQDHQLSWVLTPRGFRFFGPFEPHQKLAFSLDKSLGDSSVGVLGKEEHFNISFPERKAALKIVPQEAVLSLGAAGFVEVETSGVEQIVFTGLAVSPENAVHVLNLLKEGKRPSLDSLGTSLGEVRQTVGKGGRARLVLSQMLNRNSRGLVLLEARDASRSWLVDRRWVGALNLEIIAKHRRGYAWVKLSGTDGNAAIRGASLRVFSRANRLIGSGKTDSQGLAHLNLAETPDDPAAIVVAEKKDSFGLLPLKETAAFTEPEPAPPSPRAYIAPERQVYRPGDKAQVLVLLRDDLLRSVNIDYELSLVDLAGNERGIAQAENQIDGGRLHSLQIPRRVRPGNYRLQVRNSENGLLLGETALRLQGGFDRRVSLSIASEKQNPRWGEPIAFSVSAKAERGLLPQGAELQGRCIYRELSEFGGLNAPQKTIQAEVRLAPRGLSSEGKATVYCRSALAAQRPVQVLLELSLMGSSGSLAGAQTKVVAHPADAYLGLKQVAGAGNRLSGQDAGLQVVLVDAQGRSLPGKSLKAQIYRLEAQSGFRQEQKRWVREEGFKTIALEQLELSTGSGYVSLPYISPEAGAYRVEVAGEQSFRTAHLDFWVEGPGAEALSVRPLQLKLSFDKESYRPGEVAKGSFELPFDGRLMLSAERNRVLFFRNYRVTGRTYRFEVPVRADMGPSVSWVARLVNSNGQRAVARTRIKVSQEDSELPVTMKVAEVIRPGEAVQVLVKVPKLWRQGRMWITAVDARSVSGYQGPVSFFVNGPSFVLQTHDLPGLDLSQVQVGYHGVDLSAQRQAELHPGRLAVSSGLIKVSPDGYGYAKLSLPPFSGRVKINAFVFAGQRMGHASVERAIGEPVSLSMELPGALQEGDELTLPVEVHNAGGSPRQIVLRASGEGLSLNPRSQRVKVAARGHSFAQIKLRAGKGPLGKIRLQGGGDQLEQEIAIAPAQRLSFLGRRSKARDKQPGQIAAPASLGAQEAYLIIGPLAVHSFAAAAAEILAAPASDIDGQLASAWLQIALPKLSAQLNPESAPNALQLFNQLSERVLKQEATPRQWVLLGQVLQLARKYSYRLPSALYERTMAELTRIAQQGDPRLAAQASFIRALAGRPQEAAQLLARLRAKEAPIAQDIEALLVGAAIKSRALPATALSELTFGSVFQESQKKVSAAWVKATVAWVFLELGLRHEASEDALVALEEFSEQGLWASDIEGAFALSLLARTQRRVGRRPYWGSLLLNGQLAKRFNSQKIFKYPLDEELSKNIQVTVTGAGKAHLGLVARTTQNTSKPSPLLGLSETLFQEDGQPLQNWQMSEGQRVLGRLELSLSKEAGRTQEVVIRAVLPAGWAYEPEALAGQAPAFAQQADRPQSMEIHGAELLLRDALAPGEKKQYWLPYRGLLPGRFHLPARIVSARFDRSIWAQTKAQILQIKSGS